MHNWLKRWDSNYKSPWIRLVRVSPSVTFATFSCLVSFLLMSGSDIQHRSFILTTSTNKIRTVTKSTPVGFYGSWKPGNYYLFIMGQPLMVYIITRLARNGGFKWQSNEHFFISWYEEIGMHHCLATLANNTIITGNSWHNVCFCEFVSKVVTLWCWRRKRKEEEEEETETCRELNPWPLNYKVCARPLCYNHCPTRQLLQPYAWFCIQGDLRCWVYRCDATAAQFLFYLCNGFLIRSP